MPAPDTIVHFLYEPGDGGLDRVAILLANGMAKRGISVELWLTKTDGQLASLIAPEVQIRTVPTPSIGGRGIQLILQIPALAKMIREHRPRAIFSAGNQSNLSVAIAKKLAGNASTKIIQKITNPIERPGPRGVFQWLREWRFGKTAAIGDKTFVLSHAAASAYAKRYPNVSKKFVMAHLACVTDAMAQIGKSRNLPVNHSTPQLLAAGRLVEQKDYPVMFRALALLENERWHLTVIGDGPLRGNLTALAEELKIADRISFVGFVGDPTPYFAKADLLLLSSRWEGLGAVAVEAFSMGCPVVATDCCAGLTEIVGSAGYDTTPVGDALKFADAISNILARPVNKEKLISIAAPYRLNNAVDEHLRLLETIENNQ